jgi:hypothetical protein
MDWLRAALAWQPSGLPTDTQSLLSTADPRQSMITAASPYIIGGIVALVVVGTIAYTLGSSHGYTRGLTFGV